MKKEVIIGAIVLLVLVGATYLMTKIKQSGILSRQVKLYAITEEVYHLRPAQFIYYNGMEIGRVSEVEPMPNTHKKYIVGLNLHTNISLPSNIRAEITYVSIMGGREVNLVPDTTMPIIGYLASGDTISTYITSIPTQIGDFLLPFKKQLDKFFIQYPMDSLEQMFYDLQAKAAHYKKKTGDLSNTIGQKTPQINKTVADYRALTSDLNQKMPQYMQELKQLNAQLQAQIDKGLDSTLYRTTTQVEKLNQTIVAQKPTIERINAQIDTVQGQLKNLPNHPTMKKYVYDTQMPTQIHENVKETQSTIRQLYQDPKSIINPKD